MGTLFTCPHCNAVYFIDWNGQPEMAEHEPEQVPEPELEQEIETPESFEGGTDFEGGADFQSGTSFENPPQQDYAYTPPAGAGGVGEEMIPHPEPVFSGEIPQNIPDEMTPPEDPYLTPAEEIPPGTEIETPLNYEAEVPAESEAPYDFSQTLDRIPEPLTPSGTTDTADFSDVTDFANADTTAGPLTYAVVIEGIESSRLLMQLKEAMTDSRFGWDVNEILNQVGGGRLVLKGLSPAKASVLINRIKYLPFKISWRQDVLSGS
ncbi:hypothetical protein [uncultured Bdellovibrio sp.]|uniref:hypothetical protein n=1 Tax=Bdellovibrio sp. HCB-162 TaxID=3394234 RepID=UPI0025F88992|nr:hypothetical protein [uncultured Bdellovibrio sp.]